MNAKRGLIRLWLFLSILWLSGIGGLAFVEWRHDPYARTTGWGDDDPMFRLVDGNAVEIPKSNYWPYAITGLGAPAALLVMGCGMWWVVAGFKHNDTRAITSEPPQTWGRPRKIAFVQRASTIAAFLWFAAFTYMAVPPSDVAGIAIVTAILGAAVIIAIGLGIGWIVHAGNPQR